MVRVSMRAAVAVLLPFSIGLAWQSTAGDGPVTIVPAARRLPQPDTAAPAIHINSSLVLIPTLVTTAIGTLVTDLKKDDFKLFEDNIEQRVTQFAIDDAPISIGLLFDTSGSMHDKMRKACEAAAAFFKTANVADEFFLVEFGDRPKLALPFTTNSDDVYRRITGLRPFGRTSLLDAIHMALGQMKRASNSRKALVIVSDGGDNCSRRSAGQIKSELVESEAQLYSMGIFDPGNSAKRPSEERNGPQLLNELAAQSGGRSYPVNNLDQLPAISERISKNLRTEYVLGYSPSGATSDGKYHRIRVALAAPEVQQLHLSFRQGYYAPAQ